jgi:DNA sulfur modification protein DndB
MAVLVETGNVSVKIHNKFEQAMNEAYMESTNTGGYTFPVVMFQQGTRMFLSGAFPMSFVKSRLMNASAIKGDNVSRAMMSMNRPLDSKHSVTITNYLKENIGKKYIMPPLTLNVQEKLNLHTIESASTFKAGYLAIPSGVSLSVTDGQHRVLSILGLLNTLEATNKAAYDMLMADSVAVMITCEHEIKQIHQDFADCSKTKALPPSLLSLYDTRNPANRLVFDLEKKCKLFNGRIDPTSKTLSKKATYLFLANQLRQLVKHLLYRRNVADADLDRKARESFSTETEYQKHISLYTEYINHLTQVIPVLKKISLLPIDSPERGLIPKLREEGWVCLTATGLNIIGCIGYDLFTHSIKNWKEYVDKLGDIDWKRTGALWQGNVIQEGRIITSTTPVMNAVKEVSKSIGLFDEIEKVKLN